MTKTDMQLKQDIEDELRWNPQVNAARIGVSVDGGAVTLLGTVDTYADKLAAEDAIRRVGGVVTVAQDLTVKLPITHQHGDSEVAGAVQHALRWDVFVPDGIKAKVEKGVVTLHGHCTWNFQRESAVRAVRSLQGVTDVHDTVSLEPHGSEIVSEKLVKDGIDAALHRQATTDSHGIVVDTSGGKVTLSGKVASWQSIQDAKAAAWAAPGVTEVVDDVHLTISI